MNSTFLRDFLTKKEVKTMIIGTLIGYLLQIISGWILRQYPELLEALEETSNDEKSNGEKNPSQDSIENEPLENPNSVPRGGTLVTGARVLATVLQFLTNNGLLAGVITTALKNISNLDSSAVSKYLGDALPQSQIVSDNMKSHTKGIDNFSLDQCEKVPGMEYLFKILEDSEIPYQERERVANDIIRGLDIIKPIGKAGLVICLLSLLIYFNKNNTSSYHILIQKLIQALKEGRLSKNVARALVRQLRKAKIPIPAEFIELIDS